MVMVVVNVVECVVLLVVKMDDFEGVFLFFLHTVLQ